MALPITRVTRGKRGGRTDSAGERAGCGCVRSSMRLPAHQEVLDAALLGFAPQGAHASRALGAAARADPLAQGDHRIAVEHLLELAPSSGLRRTGNEEAWTDAAGRTDHGGIVEYIAANRRIGVQPANRGEVLMQAPQLARAISDQPGAEVVRQVALHVIENPSENG